MAGAVIGDDSGESKENSQTTPELETQKKEIGVLLKAPLIKGETWYLVDSRWLKSWKKYVGFDSWDIYGVGEEVNHPGPIDNSILFKDVENSILKQHLIDELDYNLMPTEAWEKLVSWYGLAEGQQPILRKVVEHGMYLKQCKVEVYLIDLKLCQNSDSETVISRPFSKGDTIGNIMSSMKEVFEIPEDAETRLWNKYMGSTYELLSNDDQTVQDAGLYSGQLIIIEKKNEDGTWQRHAPSTSKSNFSSTLSSSSSGYGSSSSYGSYGSSYSSWDYSSGGRKTAPQPGLTGLSNLGNTCFMNSALQCLSNTPHLTRYFVRGEYKDELNFDNPLGMRGEIAKAYAGLLHQIWNGEYGAVAPRQFKTQVGRFAPQFSGYQQQDSQELLAFLLDGLHEDLNRIQKKPYIEVKDADNRPDKVVAQEAWQNHRKRNDSIIVDIFHGQFKSTLVCPDCNKISVTFDPFCYLSLPLPVKKERSLEVFLVRNDAMKKPILFKLTVPKMGNVSDLLLALSKETNIPKDKMIVADVYNHRLHKIFSSNDGLSSILDRDDIFVYEVANAQDITVIPVYMREKRLRLSTYSTGGKALFGLPLLVSIPSKGLTYAGLYNLLLNRMRRYVTPPHNEAGNADCEKDKETKANGPVATDVEMSEIKSEGHGPETEEDQLEKATQNVHVNGDEDDIDDEAEADGDNNQQKDSKLKIKKKNRLFSMTLVNAFGSSDLHPLVDEDKPLSLSGRSYLALDWSSKTKEKYYDSEAADESDQHESVTRKPPQKKNCVQLSDCIEMFTSKERLGANDPWYCPSCKKHQQATKKFDLWALPEVLVVHLKRFSYNSFWRDKLDTLVDFPNRGLDMTKCVINHEQPRPVYDLIAVSNHYGGMGGGHYTAYAKNCHDSSWYSFDDSSVTPIDENQIVSKAAYVLFYQRRRSHRVSVLSDKGDAASSDAMGAEDDDWIDEGKDPDVDEDMDTK